MFKSFKTTKTVAVVDAMTYCSHAIFVTRLFMLPVQQQQQPSLEDFGRCKHCCMPQHHGDGDESRVAGF